MPKELPSKEELGFARKRKRAAEPSSSSGGKQQKIQDLLQPSGITKPTEFCETNGKLSPTAKRQKPVEAPAGPFVALPIEKMYSFTPAKTASNGVVDLTDSSPVMTSTSPRKPVKFNRDPHQGAKKIAVKNFRTTPRTDPRVYVDSVIIKLDDALDNIFTAHNGAQMNGKIPQSMEMLYKGVENACRMGYAEDICSRLDARRSEAIQSRTRTSLREKAEKNVTSIELLEAVLSAWSQWKAQMITIQSIYFYMDRAYLLKAGKPSILESGVTLFRQYVFEDPKLKDVILSGVCDLITADRSGQPFNQTLCHAAIAMFHELGVYTHVFEPRLLALSQAFVAHWSERAAQEETLAGYISSSLDLIDRELKRCETCGLETGTRNRLLKLLETHLIERQASRLVRRQDVAALLDDNNVDILEKLYSLLKRHQLTDKLRQPFEKWIDETGSNIVFDEKDQDNMVVHLLSLKTQLDNIWRLSFHRDINLGHGLRESFEAFINRSKKTSATWNTDNNKPGEMIAKYVDLLLRGGSKAIPNSLSKSTLATAEPEAEDEHEDADEDKQVNSQLDQVLDLFRFVHGKAVFEAFYKKDLARRLLLNRSASADAERSMLTRLKTECGAQFTSNLEQMFKDIEIGREEEQAYKALKQQNDEDSKSSLDLSVHILSAAAWPSYPDIPLQLPPNVQKELSKYEVFYSSKHSNRKLTWKHALAHCVLRADFPSGRKELVVSGFQAVVLLLFNDKPHTELVSYEFLKASTRLPDADLKRTLQSLACAKLRPLTKHPKGRDIAPTDQFSWDPGFSHPKYRVKINQVQLKETKEENKETHERIAEDRNFETQAAVVRIMKAKKTIAHNNLIAEVIEATKKRGVLSVADIKKNIDRLIEKEYMEREEGNTYAYIA